MWPRAPVWPTAPASPATKPLALATRLARLPVPVTVDIEGGFHDDPGAVAEFVTQLAELGIAGVNIEDGRGDTALADPAHQAKLIAAIKSATPSTFINARVDTHWLGIDRDSTLTRAEQYTAAGADGIFLPGLTDPDQIARFVTAIPLPVNILYSPTGPSLATLGTLGVRRVSTGSLLYRAALAATIGIARAVRADTPPTSAIPTYQTVQSLTQPAG